MTLARHPGTSWRAHAVAASSLAAAATLALATPALAISGPLAIVHARVIDGTGAPPSENVTILIDGDRIARIGHELDTGSRAVIDASGLTLLPGLIDSHVHLDSVPGSMIRHDSPEAYQRLRSDELPAYVAAGVTTVLDAGAPKDLLAWARMQVEQTGAGPDVLMLAPFLTPLGGYFGDAKQRGDTFGNLWEPIDGPERLIHELDAVRGAPGVVGVKVTIERGFGPIDVWPIFDAAMRGRIRDETAARQMPVFVHSMSDEEHQRALELSPKVMVHSGYPDGSPSAETLRRMKAQGVTVMSTLTVYDLLLVRYERARLDDPLVVKLTPKVERDTANDDAAWDTVTRGVVDLSSPSWIPDFVRPLAGRFLFGERAFHSQVDHALRALSAIHDAGIPIALGTDSGCWPLLTSMFHGPSTIRELELLVRAGLSPMEAIVAATSVPAHMLGIDRETGTVSEGKRANLVLVKGDPLADISAMRHVTWSIKAGVAHTPDEWLAFGKSF